jgi:hypothetical protein
LSIEIVCDGSLDGCGQGPQIWEMLRFRLPEGLIGPVLVALLLVGWPVSPANGSIVQALELQELVAHADRIVLGRVLFSESFRRPDGQLGTWHRIEVEREVRGSAPDEQEVIVETLGGQVGDIAMRVEGEPSFTVGERVLVFVRDGGPYTAFRPVGMGQGVMRVRMEQGIQTVTQNREGLMLMRRNADGRLERAPGAVPSKERLDVLLSKVRDLVEQSARGTDE